VDKQNERVTCLWIGVKGTLRWKQ